MPAHRDRRKVEVTKVDIERGLRNDSSLCVVATALARSIPEATRILVDTQTIRYTDATNGRRYAYLTPIKAQAYVVAFDAGDTIEPFAFWLNDPVPMRQHILTEEGRRISREKAAARRALDAAAAAPITPASGTQRKIERTEGDRRQPPTVFRGKVRTYGMRALRINQARGQNGFAIRDQDG
jgi:hypothetical protein